MRNTETETARLLREGEKVFRLSTDEISATVNAMNDTIRRSILRRTIWSGCPKCIAAKRLAVAHVSSHVRDCPECIERIKRGVSGYAGLCRAHRARFDTDRTCAYHRTVFIEAYATGGSLLVPIAPFAAENRVRKSQGLTARRAAKTGRQGKALTQESQVAAIRKLESERDARRNVQVKLERTANVERYASQVAATGQVDFSGAVYSRDMVVSSLPMVRASD